MIASIRQMHPIVFRMIEETEYKIRLKINSLIIFFKNNSQPADGVKAFFLNAAAL